MLNLAHTWSGGIDSGSIVAFGIKEIFIFKKPLLAGFDLNSASELNWDLMRDLKAENMSALYKTEHYEMVLKAGDMERCLSSLFKSS